MLHRWNCSTQRISSNKYISRHDGQNWLHQSYKYGQLIWLNVLLFLLNWFKTKSVTVNKFVSENNVDARYYHFLRARKFYDTIQLPQSITFCSLKAKSHMISIYLCDLADVTIYYQIVKLSDRDIGTKSHLQSVT